MAYLAETVMEQWITNQLLINRNELNRGSFGAYNLGRAYVAAGQAPLTEAEVADKLKTLSNQPLVAVMKKGGVTISTARTAVGTAKSFGESGKVTLVRNVVEAAFGFRPDDAEENGISKERYMETMIQQAVQGIKNQVDTVAIAAIDAAKTQVSGTSYPFVFDGTADAFLIDGASGVTDPKVLNELYLAYIEALPTIYMANGLHTGMDNPISVLGSPNCQNAFNYSLRFKDANYQNLGQIVNGLGVADFSTNIAVSSPEIGVTYSMTPGTYGITTWTSSDARERRVGNNAEARTIRIPGFDHDIEMYMEKNFTDYTGSLGAQYAKVYDERIALSFDYVIATEYQSAPTTTGTGIVKGLWRTTA